MTYAYLWNPNGAGSFIAPTLSSSGLAASSLPSLPGGNGNWTSVNLLNSSDPGAYPIVTFSYIMVFQELNVYGGVTSQTRAQALVNYLWFVVHDGRPPPPPPPHPPPPPPTPTPPHPPPPPPPPHTTN